MKITCPECDGTVSKDGEIYVCDKCHARSDCTSPEYHKTHFYCPGCTFQDPHAPMSKEADLRAQLAQRDEMLAKVPTPEQLEDICIVLDAFDTLVLIAKASGQIPDHIAASLGRMTASSEMQDDLRTLAAAILDAGGDDGR